MATDKKVLTFRPDAEEAAMVRYLCEKYRRSKNRAIGEAIRAAAKKEGYKPLTATTAK